MSEPEVATDYTNPATIDVDTVRGNIAWAFRHSAHMWNATPIWPNVTVMALALALDAKDDEIERLRADSVTEITERCLADSKAWFPHLHESQRELIVHHALGLGGEVGEVLNLVKKIDRQTRDNPAGITDEDLGDELADTFVYLLDLAHALGIDIVAAWQHKRQKLIERWGPTDER